MSKKSKPRRPVPRVPRGFRDIQPDDLIARRRMLTVIREVYERFGFAPLETPALEFVDVLGKFMPESETPDGGIFAIRDDDEEWIALRYDLTAPLSRFVAGQGQDLPLPFRRYQIGPVWRREKPGPGRFREFYQCDFDSVGAPSMAADAEACAILAQAFEALGIKRGDYLIKVNNRKVLNGVLDTLGLPEGDAGGQRLGVLRAVDKLDRLGKAEVRKLLGEGRLDESGDFTKGAELADEQIEKVLAFIDAGIDDRGDLCKNLRELVGESAGGIEGVQELELIGELLDTMDLGSEQVIFDPSVVRGLAYYTGPVFEAELTMEITDEKGRRRPFGSVAGGGRYDDLVKRFTGMAIPATGASIGIDRLVAALMEAKLIKHGSLASGPIMVLVLDKKRLVEYQQMVNELRKAGLPAELYLGTGGYKKQGKQLTYADRRGSPIAIIAGGNEFDEGMISIKDMILGQELAGEIENRDEWRKGQPAQIKVPRAELIAQCQTILARH